MATDRRITEHYTRVDVSAAVTTALKAIGKDARPLSLDDLAPIDEFHVRGRAATAELTGALGLSSGMRVLDVGSGVGGPARYVAATYQCTVVGIDLTEEFCRVAGMLAERVGLGDRVEYRPGNALAMPFSDGSFDAAYTQHVAMNIEDKAQLYAEVWRVLKPGARFGIYDLLQGDGGDVLYPVPWARDRTTSFLVRPAALRALLETAGFAVESWRDTTAESRLWMEETKARAAEPNAPPSMLRLLFAEDAQTIVQNLARNLLEDRVAPTQVICAKP
jgi:ubiquinone/menaquinone biosynthesis C-methylase UbiE